jgi:hypothetical protein
MCLVEGFLAPVPSQPLQCHLQNRLHSIAVSIARIEPQPCATALRIDFNMLELHQPLDLFVILLLHCTLYSVPFTSAGPIAVPALVKLTPPGFSTTTMHIRQDWGFQHTLSNSSPFCLAARSASKSSVH